MSPIWYADFLILKINIAVAENEGWYLRFIKLGCRKYKTGFEWLGGITDHLNYRELAT